MNKYISLWLIASIMLVFTSCKTEPVFPERPPGVPPTTEETLNQTADSVYMYSKEVYLWNAAIPDYNTFNPRQYKTSDEVSTAEAVLEQIAKKHSLGHEYSRNNRYFSYATTYEEAGLSKSGEAIDYGFFIKAGRSTKLGKNVWFVNYVYPDSEAGKHISRGWIVNKVNDHTLSVTENDASEYLTPIFISQKREIDKTTKFEFINPNGDTLTHTFKVQKFQANPILYDSTFEAVSPNGNVTVAYLVFNRFFGESARTALAQVFNNYKNRGVKELILDLRYNGGGMTKTQDTLANLIAPAGSNTLMYKQIYNEQLQNNKYPLLKKKFGWPDNFFKPERNQTMFYTNNSLKLPRVFIIISDATASASELLINNLQAVMDVQLIGDKPTYGKPVGFFGIDLFKKVTFYPASFYTTNQKGKGNDYYDGIPPQKEMKDGVDKNWGKDEDCFYAALFYINNGYYPTTQTLPRSVYSLPRLKVNHSKLNMIKDF